MWYQNEDEEDEDLMFSPALLARRASESWINAPAVEVDFSTCIIVSFFLHRSYENTGFSIFPTVPTYLLNKILPLYSNMFFITLLDR